MPHLFVDVSSHGFGHLAQTAPVLNRLAEVLPDVRITLRSGLPMAKLRQRISAAFTHIAAASDFGYVMVDALQIDLPATAAAYRTASADFSARVAADVELFEALQVDAVLANVSYVPLAAAARAGIPALAMCSLNWADLFEHYFGHEAWAPPLHAKMLAAYRSATFLRPTPGMPMAKLDRQVTLGPLATLGRERRAELRAKVGAGGMKCPAAGTARIVLIALGGIPTRLPVERWPILPDTHWLIPAAWQFARPDMTALEDLAWSFVDVLRSVDAIVTKPGYGTFAEAACNGTAVLYQRREDWPEQEVLIDWLKLNARAREISGAALRMGEIGPVLDEVLADPLPPVPQPVGIDSAVREIAALLT